MALGPEACPDLPSLREHIGDCHRCALGDTRTCLVFGVGDPHARLMFVGEAPGKNEDLKGDPFVGAAGKLLDELLAGIGLSRSQVYIANVLKCRPPGNRDPLAPEIETCTPFLARQIELVDPDVIATLGNFATRFVLETTAGITKLRGRFYRVGGRKVVPIFHPAVALYDASRRADLVEDFRRLRAVLDMPDEGGPGGADRGNDARVDAAEGGVAIAAAEGGGAMPADEGAALEAEAARDTAAGEGDEQQRLF